MTRDIGRRQITRVWRGAGAAQNEACVEWTAVGESRLQDKSEHDRLLPPSPELHAALDAFKPFAGAPYSVHNMTT